MKLQLLASTLAAGLVALPAIAQAQTVVSREIRPLHPAVVSRIKVMARLDIAERRIPQDGRIGLTLGGKSLDVRVSTLPSRAGEGVLPTRSWWHKSLRFTWKRMTVVFFIYSGKSALKKMQRVVACLQRLWFTSPVTCSLVRAFSS